MVALDQGESHRDRELENYCSASFAQRLDTRHRELSLLANVFDSSCHWEDTALDRDKDVTAEAEVTRGEPASFSCEKGALNAACTWPGRDEDKSQKSLQASTAGPSSRRITSK